MTRLHLGFVSGPGLLGLLCSLACSGLRPEPVVMFSYTVEVRSAAGEPMVSYPILVPQKDPTWGYDFDSKVGLTDAEGRTEKIEQVQHRRGGVHPIESGASTLDDEPHR